LFPLGAEAAAVALPEDHVRHFPPERLPCPALRVAAVGADEGADQEVTDAQVLRPVAGGDDAALHPVALLVLDPLARRRRGGPEVALAVDVLDPLATEVDTG